MPTIEKVVLTNFKKFERLELKFDASLNILVGDNETGKSSVLLALDVVMSASRAKVEALGIESLLRSQAVKDFMAGPRRFDQLPRLQVEIYLSASDKPGFNGKNNSHGIECDGLRMDCAAQDEYSKEVAEMLSDHQSPFPFEYYATTFTTFAGESYSGYKKHVRHLSIDSSRIDTDHAAREYTRSLFGLNADARDRNKLESMYRRTKGQFRDEHLAALNSNLKDYQFAVRTNTRSNLETDLVITEEDLPIETRGKGRQCFVKTEFALSKGAGETRLDALLLEEPENHLSNVNMRRLVDRLAKPNQKQLFIATHSSLICSRLDLRKALLLGVDPGKRAALQDLPSDTAKFFMKAPDNNVLEFALSKKVILVEGDAEFILLDALYAKHSGGSSLESDGVHVISVGGTSFKRYLDLARLLGVKTAVVRDNDGSYKKSCQENYVTYQMHNARVFADQDDERNTFEICLYRDNQAICDKFLGDARRTLSVQDYMLSNKADAAFELLEKTGDSLSAPAYIQEAIAWIRK